VPDDQPDGRREPQRVLGIPLGSDRRGIVEDEEQRVLGLPVRWLDNIGRDASRSLGRLFKAGRSLLRRGK
jgi:hypothetical protein